MILKIKIPATLFRLVVLKHMNAFIAFLMNYQLNASETLAIFSKIKSYVLEIVMYFFINVHVC